MRIECVSLTAHIDNKRHVYHIQPMKAGDTGLNQENV